MSCYHIFGLSEDWDSFSPKLFAFSDLSLSSITCSGACSNSFPRPSDPSTAEAFSDGDEGRLTVLSGGESLVEAAFDVVALVASSPLDSEP